MHIELLGAFGLSREEKILPYMKKYLQNTEYKSFVNPKSIKNLLAFYDQYTKNSRTMPVFFDNPNHADVNTLQTMKYIQQKTNYPEKPVRVFLYGLYESLKSGTISVTTIDKTLKKPLPIDPKKLIYGGIILTGLLATGWILQNVKAIIPQKRN